MAKASGSILLPRVLRATRCILGQDMFWGVLATPALLIPSNLSITDAKVICG